MPIVDFENVKAEQAFEFAEWVGMLSLKGDTENGAPDNYLTTYEVPEPNQVLGQVRYLEWRGFFSEKDVAGLFEELR